MHMFRRLVFLASLAACLCSEAFALTPQEAEARLRMAMQIARETNNRSLVREVEQAQREIGRIFKRTKPDGADEVLRAVEGKVGIDPGGWAMAGQPLFFPKPEMMEKYKATGPKLDAAMKSDDAAAVRAVTAEMLAILGDQAGVPDGRRAGSKAAPKTFSEAEGTKLFLDALKTEVDLNRTLSEGRPLPDKMARTYGYILKGVVMIRPFAEKHQPGDLAALDQLTRGLASILIAMQQPEGHFPFPDLRGKNIRFGDMITKALAEGKIAVRDGWVVSVDPTGGTQFDTGLCGTALLLAGELHKNEDWKRAGLRAAEWALAQPCCPNFNYNAFSVSLLAHAARVSGDAKYLDGALKKFRVGVAPGQVPSGRWIDAHNARSVYHVIILRALGDLATALPAEKRGEVDVVAKPAIRAMLDEFDAMGITVEALPELITLARLYPEDTRLAAAVQTMAASLIAKSSDGSRVKMGSPHQLAALPLAAK